ncbi:hypothetical protein GPA07_00090 [Bacillus sp. ms-22]|uniref:hypothetical protein n=1 Tax=Bacillus sp. ms-22 TaxID=2683680 RepID=UPI0012FCEAAB|nr:hypothetical protein [Bacillus sp. ms-22]QGX63949.1 hypothetical protein GPA07_00090 [Bacillus sp. ms-22]
MKMTINDISPVTLKSMAHYNRTVNGIKTTSREKVNEALRNGCGIQEINYILRYPEVMLCDLSNPEYPLNLCDNETIIECFDLINSLLGEKIKNTNFTRIYGDNLKSEIAINGPTMCRGHFRVLIKAIC